MSLIILVIVAAVLILVFKKFIAGKSEKIESGTGKEAPPYFKKKALLNEGEQALFHKLTEAMPNCIVFAQVRLADIVGIKKTNNWQAWFNKVNRKSVDFVICNKSFVVLACIELDGKTHEQEDRKKADGDKDAALKAAGIPILRIEASKLLTSEEIKLRLENLVLH
jgi:very-short-patch-repair endonuclease